MKPFYLDGAWQKSSEIEAVYNPWSGEKLADVCMASTSDVEAAIINAQDAFQITRKLSSDSRATTLEKVCRLLQERREEFVDVIVAEAGKPVTFAEAEVDRACLTFRFAAAQVLTDEGHGINMEASAPGLNHFGFAKRFPIGVILGITPFNFPLNLVAHKVAPCLATGNTMVLKPALKTPLTALMLAQVLHDAGVPRGQVNVLPFHHELVESLLTDSRIKMLSFTGSVDVGWSLKSKSSKMKVALELGGNAAVVVEPDCDWREAIPKIALAAYGYAGQSCISVQRIFVHKDIFSDFRQELQAFMNEKIIVGDPSKRGTIVGPMINASAREKIVSRVNQATQFGASLLTPLHCEGSSVLRPVLMENVSSECSVCSDEVFAPLAILQPYSNFSEALKLVNTSRFGLQAGVFTNNIQKALLAFEELEVGGVMINEVPTFRTENMPYGGVKDSGTGREGIRYAMEEMTELRSLVMRKF